jgi:hypothetical protein
MKKVRILAWLNFIVYVLAFTVSQLSQLNLIGNGNMGDISKKYDKTKLGQKITILF